MTLDGKRVLVTGGTGSLGQAVVRRLLGDSHGRPERVTVFSRDEAKQHEMRLQLLGRPAAGQEPLFDNSRQRLRFRIGDVRDYEAVLAAAREADVVVHAAALKQVPTCEYFPLQAVQTNVLGTATLARAVRDAGGVEVLVGVSTDKACKPVNVMGMTKAIMERVLVEANLGGGGTRFACVRYGNVIGSRGSVVPLFLDQIAHGGPVTVTCRAMTRFVLTLDHAADAIFDALAGAGLGEIYVPRAPSARIVDLAEVLIDGRNVALVETGMRPGEKIHEIMVSEEECQRCVQRAGYYVIRPMLPECRTGDTGEPTLRGEYCSADVTLDRAQLRRLLAEQTSSRSLVPTGV